MIFVPGTIAPPESAPVVIVPEVTEVTVKSTPLIVPLNELVMLQLLGDQS